MSSEPHGDSDRDPAVGDAAADDRAHEKAAPGGDRAQPRVRPRWSARDPEEIAADRAMFIEQDRAAEEYRARERAAALNAAIEQVLKAGNLKQSPKQGGKAVDER